MVQYIEEVQLRDRGSRTFFGRSGGNSLVLREAFTQEDPKSAKRYFLRL